MKKKTNWVQISSEYEDLTTKIEEVYVDDINFQATNLTFVSCAERDSIREEITKTTSSFMARRRGSSAVSNIVYLF